MVENQIPAQKRVILGITGSIAAYKAADLASRLIRAGHTVFPILTRGGSQFITPAALSALTGKPCPVDTFEEVYPGNIAHIWLAQNCDLVVIAPASMNAIARLAAGLSDDMLTAVALATTAPILVAPAMNTGMWENAATQANILTLRSRGYALVEPIAGRLACRTEGMGKLADVDEIFGAIQSMLTRSQDLSGRRILVTAGPTREPIDPVRFLTNRSSGKMGYAVAEQARRRGAEVVLVAGPTSLSQPAGVDTVNVETGEQMADAVLTRLDWADVVISAAAVADYRATHVADRKLKKGVGGDLKSIDLVRNPDILAEAGRRKREGQLLVGFAAETEDVLSNAREKLCAKNLDWVVANDVTAEGAGFDVDTNVVTLLSASGAKVELPKMSKHAVADRILDVVIRDAHADNLRNRGA